MGEDHLVTVKILQLKMNIASLSQLHMDDLSELLQARVKLVFARTDHYAVFLKQMKHLQYLIPFSYKIFRPKALG